jgi:hypothetical protein
VCGDAACQRRRRADYHRQKVAADPEYRQVCLDSPQKWRSRNPRRPSSGIANSSTFGTKSSVCAILQTTTQLST